MATGHDVPRVFGRDAVSTASERCASPDPRLVQLSRRDIYLADLKGIGAPLSSRRNQFRETTGELYNKVVVLYSGLFRTSKALENLQDAGTRVFGGNQNVCRAFEGAWKSHTGFCKSRRMSRSNTLLTVPRPNFQANIPR